ncbi:putative gustatory receptor 57a [Lucilia cuprina]|uniref:Gustatory receptor n=1 Tax=Lucilia cuprina TaxID=7375 RepID=A0A0L0CI20_LUCCU|nr:putative gustatory receptor 57a [Lucilia cuprina]
MAVLRRFFSYPNTIYDCCKVFCFILFSLGCSGFTKHGDRFQYNRKSLFITWLAVCWYLGSLMGCMYVKLQDPQVENLDSLIKSIIYLEIGMSTFMYLTTVISMLSNMDANLQLYARIQYLDEKLLKEFPCKLNYEKLMRKHVLLLFSVAVIYMTVIVLAVSRASHGQEFVVNLLAGLAYTAVTGGPHMNCYAQMNMAEILSIRFRLLQKLLSKHVVCFSRLSVPQQVDCLRSLISLVQEYHVCIRHINKVYAVCLASTLLHDFTLTTSEFYLIFGGSSKNTQRENTLIWYVAVCMILPLYKMTIAPIYCDKAIREGKKCLKIIMDTECWFPRNTDVRQMVSLCLMWRKDNTIEFFCGTMIFNKQIIAVVYSQIFNYLLILIQFRMTQEMGDQIEKQKNTIQEWIGVDYV